MANALKTILVLTVFLIATFILLELSLRVYLFGLTGLSPTKVGSFSLIFSSGLVQPAANRDVWYELKPNQNTLFRGVPFRTNSQGLADEEYTLEKRPGTVRIAVVGSSWSMGSGVLLEQVYHSVLEKQFNNASSNKSINKKYEFINFGVEFYGLQEIVATVRHKVLGYKPDLILIEITGSTPSVRWAPHTSDFVPAPRRNTAWDSLVVEKIIAMLGTTAEGSSNSSVYRDSVGAAEEGLYFAQIERALVELAGISKSARIPVAIVWLRANVPAGNKMDQWFLQRASVNGIAAAVINLDDFLEPGDSLQKLLVSRVEPHPNALGHELIAGELRRQLFDNNPLFAAAPE